MPLYINTNSIIVNIIIVNIQLLKSYSKDISNVTKYFYFK